MGAIPSVRVLALVLLASCLSPLQAGPFTNIYFFGDSLSDTGNVYRLTANAYPAAPYVNGHFTNGPNWADTFAYLQGVPNAARPAGMGLGPNWLGLQIPGDGGNNYAIGGARTGTGGTLDEFGIPSGLSWQIQYYLQKSSTADPNALYVLFGGGNDLRDASLLAPAARDQAAVNAAANMAVNAIQLAQKGARNFLIINAPNIGNTPEARIVRNNADSALAASFMYNAALGFYFNYLPALLPSANLFVFDLFSIFELIYYDASNGGAATGITNATTPCFAGYAGSSGTNCATALFADDIHPTSIAHTFLGYFASNFINQVTAPAGGRMALFASADMIDNPEPGSFVLMATGAGLILLARKRRVFRARKR